MIHTHWMTGRIAPGVNYRYAWPGTGKTKTLDLAIGTTPGLSVSMVTRDPRLDRVLLSCEAKACMTEHGKSQPRLFDELESSYSIVNNGDPAAIAAGVVVINMATRFVAPLRQTNPRTLDWTYHRQPAVTENMVRHLRGLRIRTSPADSGFDAFCLIVIETDNIATVTLVTKPPAPAGRDPDSYMQFLGRIVALYDERFAQL